MFRAVRQLVRCGQLYWRELRGGRPVPCTKTDADLPDDQLVKIRVDLPDHDSASGESFWAEPLGGDLFRLRNTPFYAYDLHFLDVVRAIPDAPDILPTIREVVERSGHRTLRVLFRPSTSERQIQQILRQLGDLAVNHERASGRFYALDARPEADYQAVVDLLYGYEVHELLHYETCESAGWGQPPESSGE